MGGWFEVWNKFTFQQMDEAKLDQFYPRDTFSAKFRTATTMDATPMHIAMFPWFAMGHLTPYLHLANNLADKGHRISFLAPRRTQAKLEHFNLHPNLISFVPLDVPHVDGLPHGAETTSDVPFSLIPLLMTAMDHTEKDLEALLLELKPNFVFFDESYWVPNVTRRLGIKSIQCWVNSLTAAAYVDSMMIQRQANHLPAQFPDSSIKLNNHEARALATVMESEFGSGVSFYDRINKGARFTDAVGFKGCREIEGIYADYLETLYGKPVLLFGPLLPVPPTSTLEEKWATWLGKFKAGSVIYCALGSECTLQQNQFQELLLGLEFTGFPFLAALRPPTGFESVEAAVPEGFKERVQGRGIVHSGWVQQQLILEHPATGCFVTHCGTGSLVEALFSKCQLVFLPNLLDQVINARMMSRSLKAGVEVQKGEDDGLFTKDSICKAVKMVMDDESEIGREVRVNHTKLKNILLSNNLESTYTDSFCRKLQDLLR